MSEAAKKILAQLSVQSDSASPLVRWGILVIVLIILWFAMVEPFLIWRGERMDALNRRIDKVERMVAMQQGADTWISAEQDYSKAMKAVGPLFIEGDSYAIVQGKFMALVRKQAGLHKLVVKSQHLRDRVVVPHLGEAVGIDLHLQGHLTDALAFIDALIRTPRLLTIDSLYIAPAPGVHASPEHGEKPVLLMLGIKGYRLLGGQKR